MSRQEEVISLLMALRRQGISDARVLSALETVPRERFVPRSYQEQAYEDVALPIACGQTISQPFVVAYMTEKLKVGMRHRVLEVGTGSGYQAAVLSRLCRRVYSLERYRTLMVAAEELFRDLDYHNITCMLADGTKGWEAQAPFDRIVVTAAGPEVPPDLMANLSDEGGILIAPIGESSENQKLMRYTKTHGDVVEEELLPVRFVHLVHGVAREL
ncbi:MAG: protein-L-isoaspartate(D-aspartate) O-methyltransferase [Alphaproteobacteria bacterium]|nr:MAG: protein-L-isoaspartate(D-aspartate) O-methyltransferase [Alphaproteobacteria bacterium]